MFEKIHVIKFISAYITQFEASELKIPFFHASLHNVKCCCICSFQCYSKRGTTEILNAIKLNYSPFSIIIV